MAKKDLDPSELHDPLEQNLDENTAEEMVMEHILDAGEVTAAEESAMHTDNEVALEATHETVAKPLQSVLQKAFLLSLSRLKSLTHFAFVVRSTVLLRLKSTRTKYTALKMVLPS
jgi:hypothetical protein